MIKPRVLTFFYWFIIQALAIDCQLKLLQLTHSSRNCVFQFHNPCSNFTFEKCFFTSLSNLKDVKNQPLQNVSLSEDWKFCTQVCCKSDALYPQTFASIKNCQDKLSNSYLKRLIVILSIVISVTVLLTILALILICYWHYYIGAATSELGHTMNNNEIIERPVPQSANNLQIMNEQWSYLDKVPEQLSQKCSICLDSCANLQLKCKHVFHSGCLAHWMSIKPECPMCKGADLNIVIIYCEKCFLAKKEENLVGRKDKLKNLDQKCTRCQLGQIR